MGTATVVLKRIPSHDSESQTRTGDGKTTHTLPGGVEITMRRPILTASERVSNKK